MLNRIDELELGDVNQREELASALSALELEGWQVDIVGHKGRPARIFIRDTMTNEARAERASQVAKGST